MPNNYNEEEQQPKKDSLIKKKGKKLVRDKAIKLGKKAGKAAAKVAAQAILGIGKALLGLLAGVGAPVLIGAAILALVMLIIYIATSLFFSMDTESLDADGKELREYITELSDASVDMSKLEEVPYRLPEELIIAAMQIYDSDSTVETKNAAKELAEALSPIFTYEVKKGETVSVTTTCVEDKCSDVTTTQEYSVNMLTSVEAWDRIGVAEVVSQKTEWESAGTSSSVNDKGETVTSTTKTQSDFIYASLDDTIDYTLYERALSADPFEYGVESKKAVEAIYQIADGLIMYTEWLNGDTLTGSFDGTITPGDGVPLEYMPIYLAAEKKFGVDWYYLAAFHFVETAFSTISPMLSSVGAEGHMQFMPCTFVGWSYPACKGNGGAYIPDSIKHSPVQIKKYGGYGVDGDGDGKADPFNLKDAVFSTANYLNASGFRTNIDGAIYKYNHADWYVKKIKDKAKEFKDSATYMPGEGNVTPSGGFIRPAAGRLSSKFGPRYIPGKPGSFHYGTDIANGWDTPIIAMANGQVMRVKTGCPRIGSKTSTCGGGWGNHIIIRHTVQGKVYDAVYAHFTKPTVAMGQTVQQGQLVGLMGQSGRVTGLHTHIELYNGPFKKYGVNNLNPQNYIPF